MEVCPEAELIAFEDPATVCDRALQIGQGREVAVGERLIEDGPEGLGGLKLRRVAGQVDEPDPLRDDQVRSVCQPVLSRPSTMFRSRPAPASRANSARSAAKNGLEMPSDTYQTTSPEVGCTKAVT